MYHDTFNHSQGSRMELIEHFIDLTTEMFES